MKQNISPRLSMLILLAISVFLGGALWFGSREAKTPADPSSMYERPGEKKNWLAPEENGVPCSQEAKICPDGSAVGRSGPDCEFEACPGVKENGLEGSDRDEHGCIPSAGYSWCEEKKKCLRNWEEKCGGQTTYDSSKEETYQNGEPYFKITVPDGYAAEFVDMGTFYEIRKNNDVSIPINRMWTLNGDCNWITTLKGDNNFVVKVSNEKATAQYPSKAYTIDVDRNFECGECLMLPGSKYRNVELKVADNKCFSFMAGVNFDKNIFDATVESFIYYGY